MTRRDGDDTHAWRIFRILAPVVVAAIVLAAWQAWVTIARIPQYLVPSPLVVEALSGEFVERAKGLVHQQQRGRRVAASARPTVCSAASTCRSPRAPRSP